MFKKKETSFYKEYYLFGKCFWKHQKNIEQVSEYLLSRISDMCADTKHDVNQNISGLQSYIDDLNSKLDSEINLLNADLQSQITNLDSDLKQYVKDHIAQLNNQILQIKDDLQSVRAEFDDNYSEIKKQIKAILDFKSVIITDISDVQSKVNALDKCLQFVIDSDKNEFINLKKNIDDISNNLVVFDKKNEQQISEHFNAITSKLENNNTKTQKDISDLYIKIDGIVKELNSRIKVASDVSNSELNNVRQSIVNVDNKIYNIEENIDKLQSNTDLYSDDLKKQSDILVSLQQKIDWQNTKIHYLNAVTIKNEVVARGYLIDKDWLDAFVHYKIANYELIKLPLKDLYIDDWQDENMGKCVKIKDSPNYKYLCGDKSEYITRCQNEPSHSCEKFDKLIKKFDQEGINQSNIICVDENNHIIDGAHRASWLVYKYGENFNVMVLKLYIKN